MNRRKRFALELAIVVTPVIAGAMLYQAGLLQQSSTTTTPPSAGNRAAAQSIGTQTPITPIPTQTPITSAPGAEGPGAQTTLSVVATPSPEAVSADEKIGQMSG
jgi:hypothetical protein